jgi:hypothetical protein
LGENRLLWKVKARREQTAVESEVWKRMDCYEKSSWERMGYCGK